MLELINRFRLDPSAEYNRLVNSNDSDVIAALSYFGVSLGVLANQWSTLVATQPLAWSDQLNDSAAAHNQLMMDFDQQSYNLPGELSLEGRINIGENYYESAAENIFAYAASPFYAHAGFLINWGNTATGIQEPHEHRNNLIDIDYREIGISISDDNNVATSVGPLVVTQHLADRQTGSDEWLLGVAYLDMDNDNFYSVGEGLGNVIVNIVGADFSTSVQSSSAGGYQTLVPQGNYTVSFERNGNTLQSYSNVVVGSQSVKRDLKVEIGESPSAGFGKIVGIQFDDVDGDGQQSSGENGIAGRTLFIDENGNRIHDANELSAITDENGAYFFNDLAPGDYRIAPVLPVDREQTNISYSGSLVSDTYQLDDGEVDGWTAFSTQSTILFNQYESVGQTDSLISISVGLSSLGNPSKLFIYQDNNGNDQPDSDEKILDMVTAISGTDGFTTVDISPTVVSGTFFIGALYEGDGIDTTWLPYDDTAPASHSWRAVVSTPSDEFTAYTSESTNWLLRANSAGLATQQITISENQTVGGVNFGDRVIGQSLTPTSGDDFLLGTSGDDEITGLGGQDTINGLEGNDILSGFAGDDTIDGGSGEDILTGGAGNDKISGGVNDDVIRGDGGQDTISGDSGNDNLRGGADNDLIDAGSGDDVVNGGNGDDIISGGTGDDVLDGANDRDLLNGGDGEDILRGGDGRDTLRGGDGNDNLVGGNAKDFLFGDDGNDRISGSGGFDELTGGKNNDLLRGQAGDDMLIGVNPEDASLAGYGEIDRLIGGLGADTFVLGNLNHRFYLGSANADYANVRDFDLSENDVIQLNGSSSDYRLQLFGSNVTRIYFNEGENSDLVGVIKGEHLASFDTGFVFV